MEGVGEKLGNEETAGENGITNELATSMWNRWYMFLICYVIVMVVHHLSRCSGEIGQLQSN